jgi:hypothetical protein
MNASCHQAAASSAGTPLAAAGETWLRFWFTPADVRPLALVRILTGLLGLALAGSYAADLETWFGPGGMLPVSTAAPGRAGPMISVFAWATSPAVLRTLFGALVAALVALTLGLASRLACPVAAVLWAALLNRGPVLAGPADDCLAVLLWCLAVGPSGGSWSLDRWIRDRRGSPPPAASPWARVALGLVRVHAVAITIGMLLAQLKGDVWWDGTAAWWLTARSESRLVDLTGLYRGSEYLMNLVTHATVAFEIVFAGGLWFDATRRLVARAGLVAWPVIGILAGEPFFGLALAIFCVADAARR